MSINENSNPELLGDSIQCVFSLNWCAAIERHYITDRIFWATGAEEH